MQKASFKMKLKVSLSRSLINILYDVACWKINLIVFLGNLVIFDNILSTVEWELLSEMMS